VKEEPPFAKINAGNVNRKKSKRRIIHNHGRKKFIAYEVKRSIPYSVRAKISMQNDLRKVPASSGGKQPEPDVF
jgi:hypothetical protein